MRSFQQVVVFLFALLVSAFAQEYESTVYITSTVYRVSTVQASGHYSGVPANQTSTIAAVYPTGAYPHSNSTTSPTGTMAQPSPSQFTGAASSLNVGSYVLALAAGVGYLVL